MKRFASERWDGHVCDRVPAGTVVTATGVPPDPGTLKIAPVTFGANKILSSAPHDPPSPRSAGASVIGRVPSSVNFFRDPPAKNATARPSGDQNGNDASSVPGSIRDSDAASARTQRCVESSTLIAENTSCLPSGETA